MSGTAQYRVSCDEHVFRVHHVGATISTYSCLWLSNIPLNGCTPLSVSQLPGIWVVFTLGPFFFLITLL